MVIGDTQMAASQRTLAVMAAIAVATIAGGALGGYVGWRGFFRGEMNEEGFWATSVLTGAACGQILASVTLIWLTRNSDYWAKPARAGAVCGLLLSVFGMALLAWLVGGRRP
jgi:hypothetical protein